VDHVIDAAWEGEAVAPDQLGDLDARRRPFVVVDGLLGRRRCGRRLQVGVDLGIDVVAFPPGVQAFTEFPETNRLRLAVAVDLRRRRRRCLSAALRTG